MTQVFDALSHPIRRHILELLRAGGMTAGQIADAFEVSKPTMSGHFAKLKAAGLIAVEQRGASLFYTLNLSVVDEALMGFLGRVGVGASTHANGGTPCTPVDC